MKERPIIFSAPMVRAILAGTKLQTRRALKQVQVRSAAMPEPEWRSVHTLCPYGQRGDRLWVKETWRVCGGKEYEYQQDPSQVMYRATHQEDGFPFTWESYVWRPSIYMPRWASRILLDVTAIRVERLQDISEADALAEGITPKWEPGCSGRLMEALGGFSFRPAASAYAELWEQINGPGSWDANPWVWVIEFKRVTP